MGLETFTGKVSDLVATNPPGTDPKSQGDDHLRGIKTTIIGQSVNMQLGQSATATQNFTFTTGLDGTMKLARGNVGATTQDVMTVSAAGKVAFTQNKEPAFAAVADGSQTIPATPTKILFQTERFDTDNCFASSRFTPTVAGYYQLNAGLAANASSTQCGVYIQKNGVTQASLFLADNASFCSVIMQMNGTTDYAEAFGYLGTPGLTSNATFGGTQFSGSLVRPA